MVKSKYPVLDSAFGVLNPAYSDLGTKNYDTEEAGFLDACRNNNLEKLQGNNTQRLGQMLGVVLRVEGYTNSGGSVDPTDWSELSIAGTTPADRPALLQVRVRIPELHSCLPIPYELPTRLQEHSDHDIINMYPVFTARVANYSPVPPAGSLVWVDFQNKETMTGGILLETVSGVAYNPLDVFNSALRAHASGSASEPGPGGPGPGGGDTGEELGHEGRVESGKSSCPIDTGFIKDAIDASKYNKKAIEQLVTIQDPEDGSAPSKIGDPFQIPDGKMVRGTNINHIAAAAQEEIDFWKDGAVAVAPTRGIKDFKGPQGSGPKYRTILEVNRKVLSYWIMGAGDTFLKDYAAREKRVTELYTNPITKVRGSDFRHLKRRTDSSIGPSNKKELETILNAGGKYSRPWSAVTIHYILYRAMKMGAEVGDILNIGINWASHLRYYNGVRQKSNDWKVFALPGFCDVIQINVGDILILPRGLANSTIGHGDIVYKIEGGRAYLTGGNPTVRSSAGGGAGEIMLDEYGCIRDMGYDKAYGISGAKTQYTLILKYKPKLTDYTPSGVPSEPPSTAGPEGLS